MGNDPTNLIGAVAPTVLEEVDERGTERAAPGRSSPLHTQDMVAVRAARRVAFVAGGARVRSVAPDDDGRRELVADHCATSWAPPRPPRGEEASPFPNCASVWPRPGRSSTPRGAAP